MKTLRERTIEFNRARQRETAAYTDIRELVSGFSATLWKLLPQKLRDILEAYRDVE